MTKKATILALFFLFLFLLTYVDAKAKTKTIQTSSESQYAVEILPGGELETMESKKTELSPVQKKLSTDLLQLVNENFLLPGQTLDAVKKQMQELKQFRPAGAVCTTGEVSGDMVYVYIYLNPTASTSIIDPYACEVDGRDEENNIAVAWVEVNNLEALAALEGVRSIRPVLPPTTQNADANTISIVINEVKLNTDAPPFIDENNRVQVPLRAVSEALGCNVSWNSETQKISIEKTGLKVEMTVGDKTFTVNGKNILLDTAPVIKSDRTFVPIRALGELLNNEISWDGAIKTVYVTSKDS